MDPDKRHPNTEIAVAEAIVEGGSVQMAGLKKLVEIDLRLDTLMDKQDAVLEKVITAIEGHAYGKSQFGQIVSNNNLSQASAMILKNTLFAIAANEFFLNDKKEIEARDLRVKDSETSREFSFTITGKEI